MSGPGFTASFAYDAVGRRTSKTINGASVSFLYDRGNIVQEQVAPSTTANTLTGGLDQFFARTDSSGTASPLTDGLGSVVGLTDSSGTNQTQYSYEPFGRTTASGASNGNSQKYTAREDDGTGLYYYRNRYYTPSMQRFISEDPIEFGGGDANLYSYVGNNPGMFRDPSGLERANSAAGTLPSQYRPMQASAPPTGGRSCATSDDSAGQQTGLTIGLTGGVGGNLGLLLPGGGKVAGAAQSSYSHGWAFCNGSFNEVDFLSLGAQAYINDLTFGAPGGVSGNGIEGGDNPYGAILGAGASAGVGIFVSNAGNGEAIRGPFRTRQINLVVCTIELNTAGKIWILSVTGGAGAAAGYVDITTTTPYVREH